jgi:NTP pyrophosphatase (non-canonical NTP hydrolase)
MATKKTAKKETKQESSESILLQESIELSEAVVKEIDNLMSSKLPTSQVGKVLGDIVSSFSQQVKELKDRT